MDLIRALGTFVRVAESGSFSAVARENGSSHSAATRLIGQLEEHFGVRLFHRSTRRLSLTEDGQDLLGHARHLLEAADGIEARSAASAPRRPAGCGWAPRSAPRGCWWRGCPALLDRYPGLSVEMVVRDRIGDLVEERLDVALQLGQPTDAFAGRARGRRHSARWPSPPRCIWNAMACPSHPRELAQHTCIILDSGPDSARWQFAGPDGAVEVAVAGRFHCQQHRCGARRRHRRLRHRPAAGAADRRRPARRPAVPPAGRLPVGPPAGLRGLSVTPAPGAAHPGGDRLPGRGSPPGRGADSPPAAPGGKRTPPGWSDGARICAPRRTGACPRAPTAAGEPRGTILAVESSVRPWRGLCRCRSFATTLTSACCSPNRRTSAPPAPAGRAGHARPVATPVRLRTGRAGAWPAAADVQRGGTAAAWCGGPHACRAGAVGSWYGAPMPGPSRWRRCRSDRPRHSPPLQRRRMTPREAAPVLEEGSRARSPRPLPQGEGEPLLRPRGAPRERRTDQRRHE